MYPCLISQPRIMIWTSNLEYTQVGLMELHWDTWFPPIWLLGPYRDIYVSKSISFLRPYNSHLAVIIYKQPGLPYQKHPEFLDFYTQNHQNVLNGPEFDICFQIFQDVCIISPPCG